MHRINKIFSSVTGPQKCQAFDIWMVVKIMVPFWVPQIIGPYYNRDPKRDHNFDNHPYKATGYLNKRHGGAGWRLRGPDFNISQPREPQPL